MLEPLGVTTLPADPDPGERKGLHFARSVGDTLYTIRKDDTLWAWHVGDDLVPTRGSSTKTMAIGNLRSIDTAHHFYQPIHHVYDGHLVLQDDSSLAIVDIRDPEKPAHVFAQNIEHMEGCVAANGHLHVQLYGEGGVYTYGRAPFPMAPSTTPLDIVRSTPDPEGHGAHCAVERGGKLYWATQERLEVRTADTSAMIATMPLNNVIGYPIVVDDNRIAVFEIYDDERNGIVFVDVSGNKPKRLASLLKKQVIRSWVRVGDQLYVVARKGSRKKSVTSLCIVNLATMEEAFSEKLPLVEADEPSQVYWLGIAGHRAAVLQGNGELHRFRIEN